VILSQWEKTADAVLSKLAAKLSPNPLRISGPLAPTDPELRWLCGQFASRHPQVTQLWAEVEGLIGGADSPDDEPGAELAIVECLRRTHRVEEQAAALAHQTALRLEADRQLAACEARLSQMRATLEVNQPQRFEREKRLMMEQLHQVQEELERTYLLNHALEDEKSALQASFERMTVRSTGLFDFESVRISQQAPGMLSIQFGALRVGAQIIPLLDVNFVAGDSGAVLVIPSGQIAAPWTGRPGELPLVFDTAQSDNAPERVRAAGLSTSTWSVVRALPAAAATALQEQGLANPLWQEALSALRAMLDVPQLLWRWDGISLRKEQVNPDYEHLWITLSGASFGSVRWPVFEFRIAVANVVSRVFSGFLKYEFPQQAGTLPQLEGWRPDIQDELGPRFELRFDLARDAFDLEAWRSLTSTDHQRFAALLIALPVMFEALQAQACTISRPWSDWEELNRLAINVLLRMAQSATEYG
jgi:hypothetical protein